MHVAVFLLPYLYRNLLDCKAKHYFGSNKEEIEMNARMRKSCAETRAGSSTYENIKFTSEANASSPSLPSYVSFVILEITSSILCDIFFKLDSIGECL